MPRLTFCGAARTVTGSTHLLQVGQRRLLLDCGMFQGRRKEAFERNRCLRFDVKSVDKVLLSHAHLDHCGNLPSMVRAGYRGPILATAATADLARVMLMDSAEIQESDVAYVNRQRRQEGRKPFEPLYSIADARRTISRFEVVDYQSDLEVLPGVTVRFVDAGHMLGSASIRIEMRQPGERNQVLLFSGDIGRRETPILRDPEIVEGATHVLMESTYGNRLHPPREDADRILRDAIHRTAERGAPLMIPAFAVGRTQELIYRLNSLAEADHLPNIPVFIDSPMATEALEVFRDHPECFDDETISRISSEPDQDPLQFRHLNIIRTAEQSRRLNDYHGPCVIVAASGMCESGRILHHLKHHLGNPDATVLFSGFQAPETLGRYLLEGHNPVPVLGRSVQVRAEVLRMEGLSGHADQHELLEWLERVRAVGEVQGVALVHGEPEAADALALAIRSSGLAEVRTPIAGEIWEF